MSLSKKPYKGCRDFFPAEKRVQNYLFEKMHETAKKFSFDPYDGPLLEEVALYKAKSGEELINDQIYGFMDRGEREVAIRPEMTPTLARMVAQVHRESPKPLRWYSIPNLMRYEKPQRGRLREHWQLNVDVFGAEAPMAELEVTQFIIELLKSYGATSKMFNILINDRKLVDHLIENRLQLNEVQAHKLYKVMDKAKKVDEGALHKMVTDILDNNQAKIFFEYLELKDFNELKLFFTEVDCDLFKLEPLLKELELTEYFTFDPTIVRGLDYYTGVVFEVFDLNLENRRAIAGGGSYANLLQIFKEEPLRGIGFGLGDVTLRDFLETHKLLPGDLSKTTTKLYLAPIDIEAHLETSRLALRLRNLGVSVEQGLNALKPNKAMKYASARGFEYAALIGTNEVKEQIISVKHLASKEQTTYKLSEIEQLASKLKV